MPHLRQDYVCGAIWGPRVCIVSTIMIRNVMCNKSESTVNRFDRDHLVNLAPEIGLPLNNDKS